MRLAFDLDGTLCTGRHEQAVPLPWAAQLLHTLRQEGHVVIIFTARGMGSSGGSVGKASALVGELTFRQLRDWGFEYDEIYFGKPSYDVLLDDRAQGFQSPAEIPELVQELIWKTRN